MNESSHSFTDFEGEHGHVQGGIPAHIHVGMFRSRNRLSNYLSYRIRCIEGESWVRIRPCDSLRMRVRFVCHLVRCHFLHLEGEDAAAVNEDLDRAASSRSGAPALGPLFRAPG